MGVSTINKEFCTTTKLFCFICHNDDSDEKIMTKPSNQHKVNDTSYHTWKYLWHLYTQLRNSEGSGWYINCQQISIFCGGTEKFLSVQSYSFMPKSQSICIVKTNAELWIELIHFAKWNDFNIKCYSYQSTYCMCNRLIIQKIKRAMV